MKWHCKHTDNVQYFFDKNLIFLFSSQNKFICNNYKTFYTYKTSA